MCQENIDGFTKKRQGQDRQILKHDAQLARDASSKAETQCSIRF
jgi:hypothetical protein